MGCGPSNLSQRDVAPIKIRVCSKELKEFTLVSIGTVSIGTPEMSTPGSDSTLVPSFGCSNQTNSLTELPVFPPVGMLMRVPTLDIQNESELEPDNDHSALCQSGVVTTNEVIRGYDSEGKVLVNEYSVLSLLGRGAFGQVKLALDTKRNHTVAIKILQNPKKNNRTFYLVQQEIDIMKTRRHPNLVRLYEVICDVSCKELYMVMEYMDGGTLGRTPPLDAVTTPGHPKRLQCDIHLLRSRFRDVLHGLEYLHNHNVVHMDIKPENILIDKETGTCKLADFGLSVVVDTALEREDDILYTRRGTHSFFAPEMSAGGDGHYHGRAADTYALGVTMYIVAFGRFPPPGELVLPTDTHPDLRDVLRRMLCKEPTLRITVSQLLMHPFFSSKPSFMPWHVRVWKESKLSRCTSAAERKTVAKSIRLRDNTDNASLRMVPAETLMVPGLF